MSDKKAIVSLSGGLDSTVVLARVLEDLPPEQVLAVNFFYGSKHGVYEQRAAIGVARHFCVDLKTVILVGAFRGVESALMANSPDPIPEGHYNDASMKATVVPGRNMIFLSVLAGIAMTEGARDVYVGVHAGDCHSYPDCRPEFIQAMGTAYFRASPDRPLFLVAPLQHRNKEQVLRYGNSMTKRVPYELTRTCYKDQPLACGKCGSCNERLEAFKLAGIPDPIEYEVAR